MTVTGTVIAVTSALIIGVLAGVLLSRSGDRWCTRCGVTLQCLLCTPPPGTPPPASPGHTPAGARRAGRANRPSHRYAAGVPGRAVGR
jgi:hypothetical protein